MNQKPFELAAKEFVKRKLWSFGFSAKAIRFAPVDLIVNENFYVKVAYIDPKITRFTIPEEAKYADVLAVVFSTLGGLNVQYLRMGLENTEKMIGKEMKASELKDFIEKDFVSSPAQLFTGYRKDLKIPISEAKILADDWYSVNEIAQYHFLGKQVPAKEIRNLIDTKQLKATQWGKGNGKRTRVKGENLLKYLAEKGI